MSSGITLQELFHRNPLIKLRGPTYQKLVDKYGAPPGDEPARSPRSPRSSPSRPRSPRSSPSKFRINPQFNPPHSRSNFLTSDRRIIVGAIPQDPSALVEYGITVILNLSGREYEVQTVEYLSYPIKSGNPPTLKMATEIINRLEKLYIDGHIIYIHCVGGHGRAGTIAALLLGRLYRWDAIDAIAHVETMRDTRADTSRNFIPTPEMPKQVQFVIKVLGNPHGKPVPDRSDKSWIRVARSFQSGSRLK